MQAKTKEELLMEKEGRGRFNLRKSSAKYPLSKRTRTGPQAVITTEVRNDGEIPSMERVKLVPKLAKDAFGNDVRVYVPYKRKRH